MPALKEHLNVPELGGTLIAESGWVRWWRVEFVSSGPDGRYKPAIVRYVTHDLEILKVELRNALEAMQALQGASLTGSYRKAFGSYVEVVCERGIAALQLWATTETGWRFARTLDIKQRERFIGILQTIPEGGRRLLDTLKALEPQRELQTLAAARGLGELRSGEARSYWATNLTAA